MGSKGEEAVKEFDRIMKDVNREIEIKKKVDERWVKEINKYIKTDLQGNPEPQCKVLWAIKKQVLGLKV